MITIRKSEERGHFDHGWLNTYHTFSFGHYYDPEHMNFRSLRVINEDWVQPRHGFPTHPHQDMEIITYVLEGALEHRDSLGTGSVIRPGEVQRMSAGTGITHSEKNGSSDELVHLMQIWILPERRGLEPGYEQKMFPPEERRGQLRLIASRDGRDGAVTVHQDVELYVATLATGNQVAHELKPGRHAWIQVARGSATLNGQTLRAGDGAAVTDEDRLEIGTDDTAEVLLFDLG
jgi:redox-sensitive bicupin YhaK (pirin superfamily)